MNTILNFVMRVAGFGKALEVLDSETSKTYATGAKEILTGVAGMLAGAAMFAAQFVAAQGGAEYWAIVHGAGSNPATAAIAGGWVMFLKGKSTIGQRHAVAKAAKAAAAPAEVPAK